MDINLFSSRLLRTYCQRNEAYSLGKWPNPASTHPPEPPQHAGIWIKARERKIGPICVITYIIFSPIK